MEYTQQEIQRIVAEVLAGLSGPAGTSCPGKTFPVEVSARHVHLTQEAVEILFGKGYQLQKKKMLSQPGEFLSQERVKLVTPKGEIANVAVLGPVRKAVQVEISATDARALGIDAPVNLSGNLQGAADVMILGPEGYLDAKGSAIIAKAHLHMTPKDAAEFGVKDGEMLSVAIDSPRPITLNGVVARVREDMALAMHIDFDEANAGQVGAGAAGQIVRCCGRWKQEAGCRSTSASLGDPGQKPASPAAKPAAAPFLSTKKLITEADAIELKKDLGSGGQLAVPKGTILTPSAKDVFTGARITVQVV